MNLFFGTRIKEGMNESDARYQNKRSENARLFREFQQDNPDADLSSMSQMAERLSGGSNWLRGQLPAKDMLTKIAQENARKQKIRLEEAAHSALVRSNQTSSMLDKQLMDIARRSHSASAARQEFEASLPKELRNNQNVRAYIDGKDFDGAFESAKREESAKFMQTYGDEIEALAATGRDPSKHITKLANAYGVTGPIRDFIIQSAKARAAKVAYETSTRQTAAYTGTLAQALSPQDILRVSHDPKMLQALVSSTAVSLGIPESVVQRYVSPYTNPESRDALVELNNLRSGEQAQARYGEEAPFLSEAVSDVYGEKSAPAVLQEMLGKDKAAEAHLIMKSLSGKQGNNIAWPDVQTTWSILQESYKASDDLSPVERTNDIVSRARQRGIPTVREAQSSYNGVASRYTDISRGHYEITNNKNYTDVIGATDMSPQKIVADIMRGPEDVGTKINNMESYLIDSANSLNAILQSVKTNPQRHTKLEAVSLIERSLEDLKKRQQILHEARKLNEAHNKKTVAVDEVEQKRGIGFYEYIDNLKQGVWEGFRGYENR